PFLSLRGRQRRRLARARACSSGARGQAGGRRRGARPDRDAKREDAHLPRPGVPRHRIPAGGAGPAGSRTAGGLMLAHYGPQLVNLLAAILLLLAFAMLSQRRIISLINLFAAQGLVLFMATVLVATLTGQTHLYGSAAVTLALKVFLLPWILHRLIRRLNVKWDVETLVNIPTIMLAGIVLVILAFNLAAPISQLAGTVTRSTLGIALALVLLAFLMMITRSKAVP